MLYCVSGVFNRGLGVGFEGSNNCIGETRWYLVDSTESNSLRDVWASSYGNTDFMEWEDLLSSHYCLVASRAKAKCMNCVRFS